MMETSPNTCTATSQESSKVHDDLNRRHHAKNLFSLFRQTCPTTQLQSTLIYYTDHSKFMNEIAFSLWDSSRGFESNNKIYYSTAVPDLRLSITYGRCDLHLMNSEAFNLLNENMINLRSCKDKLWNHEK